MHAYYRVFLVIRNRLYAAQQDGPDLRRLNAVVLQMMRQRDIPFPGADGKVLTIADFKEKIASFVEGLDVRGLNQLHHELEKSQLSRG